MYIINSRATIIIGTLTGKKDKETQKKEKKRIGILREEIKWNHIKSSIKTIEDRKRGW